MKIFYLLTAIGLLTWIGITGCGQKGDLVRPAAESVSPTLPTTATTPSEKNSKEQ